MGSQGKGGQPFPCIINLKNPHCHTKLSPGILLPEAPMPRLLLLCLILLALPACDQSPSGPNSNTASTTPAPTPVLDQLRTLWDDLDRSKLEPLMFLYPTRAALEFDAAAPGESHTQLLASLANLQPTIKTLLTLSRQTPETFPPRTPSETDPNAHMKHPIAWCQNFARILNADAGRCWEARDADNAAARLAAEIRIGNNLTRQPDNFAQTIGHGLTNTAIAKALAMSDQGFIKQLTKPALEDLKAAADAITLSEESQQLNPTLKPDLDTLRKRLSEGH